MIHALVGLVRKELLTPRRYWLNFLSGTLWGYLLFVLLFFGVQSFATRGVALGSTTARLVVGYWVFTLTNVAYQDVRYYLSMEAGQGTLEQLYLSPFPFGWLAAGKMFGGMLVNLTINLPLLLLLMVTTGQSLTLDALAVLPLVVIAVAQAYGIGLVVGGIALIYKQIGAIGLIPELLLAAAIIAPPERSPWVRLLPLNLVWRLLRRVMADGTPLGGLPAGELLLVTLQAAGLIALGWGVYRCCERVAKRQALLGQY